MNIYAIEGDKVVFIGENGWDYQREEARKCFEIGKVLTVEYTNVGGSYSEVYFKEFPEQPFNTVMFKDLDDEIPLREGETLDYLLLSRKDRNLKLAEKMVEEIQSAETIEEFANSLDILMFTLGDIFKHVEEQVDRGIKSNGYLHKEYYLHEIGDIIDMFKKEMINE